MGAGERGEGAGPSGGGGGSSGAAQNTFSKSISKYSKISTLFKFYFKIFKKIGPLAPKKTPFARAWPATAQNTSSPGSWHEPGLEGTL
jgi:hypothetical protein